MTQDIKDVLKLALEALEVSTDWDMNATGKQAQSMKAITVLRRALAEQPAQQEQGDSICQEDDGCPTELAVLQRFWRGQSIPYEHYPTWCKPAPVPEPCKQEPVAWKLPDKNVVFWEDTKEVDEYHGFKPTIPLYTTPPQRTWVGLTDDDWDDIFGDAMTIGEAIKTTEAKLKERNA